MQIRKFAGGRTPRIDHHDLHARPLLARSRQSLQQDRVTPRSVGADQHDEVGLLQVLVTHRHHVFAEGALVTGDGRGHAQARVGVDVGGADVALHQLVGDVVVLGQQLTGDVEGHRLRPMRLDAAAEFTGHWSMASGQRGAMAAHLRIQQPVFETHGLAQRAALGAQPAAVGRMLRIAADLDRILCGAWRARRSPRRSRDRSFVSESWQSTLDVYAAAGASNSS